ncbi:Protein hcp1 [Roseobacter fucihabitans]|uniref:Protein hcp1 n=1 Tax=Roseobacter fucihabitans TaxID=1537242 RepID=A0ABZ2BP93_9RHOB|nr:type VI secretion system tube protein Hcp [Roseobacter litoralis]MBC6966223.1 hypothetical protein [Roseobacter litoralis]
MAITGFLSIPDIAGESTNAEHAGEIDVFGLRWDVEQTSSASIGRIRGRSRAVRGPVVVHKVLDAASPYIADATHRGKTFQEVVLTISKFTNDIRLDYLILTMENVTFSAYEVVNESTDTDDMQLLERIEIDSGRMTLKYIVQNHGASDGDEHEVKFNY